jgi:hypothetical protein
MREFINKSVECFVDDKDSTILKNVHPHVIEHYTSLIVSDIIQQLDTVLYKNQQHEIADLCRNTIVERWYVTPSLKEIKEWHNDNKIP